MTPVIIALLILVAPTSPERQAEVIAIGEAIEHVADEFGYDKWRLAALTVKESRVRCDVVGDLGERGPGQVMAKYLPGISNKDLSDPFLGVVAVGMALDRWKAEKPEEDPWECYASGNICRARGAMRRLARIEEQLKAAYVVDALASGEELDTIEAAL